MNPTPAGRDRSAQVQRAERFLADVGDLLASSLDYEETLAGVAELAVRSLADFCIIDTLEEGEVNRLQVAHADPGRAELARALLRFPLDRRRPHPSLKALETGEPVLVPEISDDVLESTTQNQEHRRVLEALQPRSAMAVPLAARDRLLGVVLFVSSSYRFDESDLALAVRIVRLAALEVDNARLYREAKQALLARDRVLGIVAHDLRNPLNVIAMSAEMLGEMAFTDAQRAEQVQMILRSAKGMNRLIQDLLDVARIEADRLTLHREIQDPRDLVEEAVELGASLARARSLALGCDVAPDTPPILADRDRILQVLANLIGNAIKFTPAGGRIEVHIVRVAGNVRFAVSDTGPGISLDDLPRLFQSFWQSRSGSLEGAGLGLMIARGIVEAHGGEIWAESSPGQGSTFYFTIPAAAPPPQGERRRGPADRRVAGRLPRLSLEGTPT